MTQSAKEKAVELVKIFKSEARQDIYDEVFKAYDKKFGREERRTLAKVSDFSAEYHSKRCAIIAVDRELQTVTILYHLCNFDNPMKSVLADTISEIKEVKEEIEKL